MNTMRAVVARQYGTPESLKLEDVSKPAAGPKDVLVKVRAASIGKGDWHLLTGKPFMIRLLFGLTRPKFPVLGSDVAGVVEAMGAEVTSLALGDEVFGDMSQYGFGAFAQFVCAPADAFCLKPANIGFGEAAAIPTSGLTALAALRKFGRVQKGQKVLIIGASGGVGSFAVQLAANLLGADVSAVCGTRSVEKVKQLGAKRVWDYNKEDFTLSGERFDVVIDTACARSISDVRKVLAPVSTYVLVGGGNMLSLAAFGSLRLKRGQKIEMAMLGPERKKDLEVLKGCAEEGTLVPLIDSRQPLARVPDAIRKIGEGGMQGKLVIDIP
ncbi:putative zinc-binding oxidoreductase [Pavlovales sp. CCMP2436]|nr:putative zinc-binding oxidoreductase [Pavlovales sp. CCMP2436]